MRACPEVMASEVIQPRSCRGSLPRTLVFGSVGDRGQAVRSWITPNRNYMTAVVYYGHDPDGNWANELRGADFFATHHGGKFQNLLWWVDQNPAVLDAVDYVLVADDDLDIMPQTIGRIVRTTRQYNLPVASPSHDCAGRISWPHMQSRGTGFRASEPPAGVELCNFVEMTCPLLEVAALRTFLDLFRHYSDRLTGWGADYLIASACFTESRPFGVLHNVRITNPHERAPGPREIDLLEPAADRHRAWLAVAEKGGLSVSRRGDVRTWLPAPRMRCINLDRAIERREEFKSAWIEGLGFPVEFFSAFDRREVEAGRLVFPYDEAATIRSIGRHLTPGEIACATSHALLMLDEMEFTGPEGLFIFEDDCLPLTGAADMVDRVCKAAAALSGIEVIVGQKPTSPHTIRVHGGGAVCPLRPPWGSQLTWYTPQGLRRCHELLTRMDRPVDWLWRDFAREGKFAMLDPALAAHANDTTYIGNEFRGVKRRVIL